MHPDLSVYLRLMKEGWLITPALNELPQVQLEKQEEQDGFIKVCQEILKRQQNNKNNNARLLEDNTGNDAVEINEFDSEYNFCHFFRILPLLPLSLSRN